ncbi:PREDICTED: COX assembly mitochondrial protein 2 homolog [Trachymyrmex cornetzi]|uniref:COX assembly mitochondrial protein 2 homolog n=1 Tax=Trachymyrmex cornetzi TaxID=471704 RepID=UPI00084EDAC9|nr:PREDICTED: COX assembly mitochondrial protein 2 homolog [Trachymyrmex cornetzi]
MNYKSLAAHNAACNEIYRQFQDCEAEHPYRRFVGYCEHIHQAMIKCIKEQREIHRAESARFRRNRLKTTEPTQSETSND